MAKRKYLNLSGMIVATLAAVIIGAGCRQCDFCSNADNWVPLFNGKDLSEWVVKCKPADAGKQFWHVEDGTILADSMAGKEHDYIWLLTEKEYGDFILRLRFQAYRDNPGNSGVQIRSRYDDQAGWLDGPQIDINPPGPWRTGMIWDETRDVKHWLYPDVPKGKWVNPSMAPSEMVFYYSDEGPGWNELEIKAVGTNVTTHLNGVKVTEYDGTGVLDDDVHKARNVGLFGHIALQIHTGDLLKIRYKDIYIKDLSN
ncbi:MAG: 3-keto-disaccharide hydrolase [Planctomycetota bacterium]